MRRLPAVAAASLLLLAACSDGVDRTVAVEAHDFSFHGLDGFAGTAGEKVTFQMRNTGPTADHEFVVIDPDGVVIGAVGRTPVGQGGKKTVTLEKPGDYTFVCFVDDHLSRGMTGMFRVG